VPSHANCVRAKGWNEAREIRTPNLLIWSQTRCRCAIAPIECLRCEHTDFGQGSALAGGEALCEPGARRQRHTDQRCGDWLKWSFAPASLLLWDSLSFGCMYLSLHRVKIAIIVCSMLRHTQTTVDVGTSACHLHSPPTARVA
jgi:hypothetical protein